MKIYNKKYIIDGSVNENIALITDIHYYSKNDIKHLNKVLDNIKRIKPTYICISGDITDSAYIENEKEFLVWLNKLSNISIVLVSIGNHEFYIDKKTNKYALNNKLLNKIKKLNNIYLLDNSNIVLNNINFIGLTLPIEHYTKEHESETSFNKHLKLNIEKNKYNILLCHSPINVINSNLIEKIDLVLCGHMHGGVVPRIFRSIIKNHGFIGPGGNLFPNNVYGYIKKNNTNIIISSGITVLSHCNYFHILHRLFSSEIVNIIIKKKC